MEGLIFDYGVQWGVYLVAAAGCLWAWDRLFYWVTKKDARVILRLLGVVLFFTPVPLGDGSDQHAPAFVVVLFRSLLEKNSSPIDGLIWMAGGLFAGFVALSLWSLVKFLRARFSS